MLFSIIVPIYNIEKYLSRCIDSVLGQSFADFELILVDDGSPDNCPSICDEYAAKDERIKVIHKKNGGLVSARQAGVGIAKGDYIFNLDGDDAILPDALESAYEIIQKTNADMVSFSYKICVDGKICEIVDEIVEEGLYTKENLEKTIYPNLLSNKNMKNLFYFVWGKAIKRELAIKHQLCIDPVISMGEDACATVPCYLEAETVYMSKKATYLYTVRGDSLTTVFKTNQITQMENAVNYLRKISVEKPKNFDEQISRYACFICFAILAAAAEGNHFNSVREIKKLLSASSLEEEIQKAHFDKITIKSRIAIWLMKKKQIRLTIYFLYLCKEIKRLGRGGRR